MTSANAVGLGLQRSAQAAPARPAAAAPAAPRRRASRSETRRWTTGRGSRRRSGARRASAPSPPPSASDARLAITSLTFMLLCVPEPVCQTDSGNSASNSPAATRAAASAMACGLGRLEQAELAVDLGRGPLDLGQRVHRSPAACAARRWRRSAGCARSARPTARRPAPRWARSCRFRCGWWPCGSRRRSPGCRQGASACDCAPRLRLVLRSSRCAAAPRPGPRRRDASGCARP